MFIETTRFGNLEVEEEDIIKFNDGLLGFENLKRYVLIKHDKAEIYKWLQSVDDSDVAFVVMEPFVFLPDYQFDLNEDDAQDLGLEKPENATILTILVVPDNPKKISANIKAPLVINHFNGKGKQIVINNEAYPVKYYLYQEEESQGGF